MSNKETNQKGSVNLSLFLIIFGIVFVLGLGAFFALRKSNPEVATSTPGSAQSPNGTASGTTTQGSGSIIIPSLSLDLTLPMSPLADGGQTSDTAKTFSLGKEFNLKKGETVNLTDADFQIGIDEFYQTNCPVDKCYWSGIGILFEYHANGKVEKGINLMKAFGYEAKIVGTDYKTYVTLLVEKIK